MIINPYVFAGGGTPPSYGRDMGYNEMSTATLTQVMTVAGDANVGERVAVGIAVAGGLTVSSVTDSKGNTYSQDSVAGPTSSRRVYIFSCTVAAAKNLVASTDTISVTYSSAAATEHAIAACAIVGATAVDITGNNTSGGSTTETVNFTTTVATVAVVMCYTAAGGPPTYTPGSGWTVVSSLNLKYAFARQVYATSGAKTTGGVWTASGSWSSCVAAYK